MKLLKIILLPIGFALSISAWAQQYIYPAQGQSWNQQQVDMSECYVWAKGQTNYDPANPPRVATAPPPEQKRGGMLRGALVGAAVGEIADDDAGKGAAYGAAIGGLRQASANKAAQQQQQADIQAQQAQIDQMAGNYNRAYTACLEGRGYTVK